RASAGLTESRCFHDARPMNVEAPPYRSLRPVRMMPRERSRLDLLGIARQGALPRARVENLDCRLNQIELHLGGHQMLARGRRLALGTLHAAAHLLDLRGQPPRALLPLRRAGLRTLRLDLEPLRTFGIARGRRPTFCKPACRFLVTALP